MLKLSDYDRLLQWAQTLSKDRFYNYADAKLALKIKLERGDFLKQRNLSTEKKKIKL